MFGIHTIALSHRINKRLSLNFDDFVKILYDEYKDKKIPPIGLYNVRTFNKDSKLFHKDIYGNQYNTMREWIPSDIGFICRFEFFERDANELLRILGYKGPNINIPKLNKTIDVDYKTFYKNKETIKYVSKIYKHDITRFGYTFM